MNFMEIKFPDVANGPGIRVSLFVAGCHHHCKGCFNPETWDFAAGKPYGPAETQKIKDILSNKFLSGLSLLGGEPLEPRPAAEVAQVVREIKEYRPDIDVWCWTGYTFEALMKAQNPAQMELLQTLDVLVDGQFVEEKKNLRLRFRGSENQRILDCPKSLESQSAVFYDLPDPVKREG